MAFPNSPSSNAFYIKLDSQDFRETVSKLTQFGCLSDRPYTPPGQEAGPGPSLCILKPSCQALRHCFLKGTA